MQNISDFNIEIISNDGKTGVFKVGPLPRGYGHTIANSIRRVLLSSLAGAGITSIKIAGVEHEYSTVEGVKENVIEIQMNLKKVKFVVDSDEPQIIRLSAKGPKTVTGGDLDLTAPVQVVNPDQPVATLADDDTVLDLEFVVQRGYGYKEGDEDVRAEVGRLPMDAAFSPVERVNYRVDETRKGEMMNLDMITISVFTDGSIDPKVALGEASHILKDMFTKFMDMLEVSEESPEESEEEGGDTDEDQQEDSDSEDTVEIPQDTEQKEDIEKILVEDLPVSKRTKSNLIDEGIKNVGDITSMTSQELLDISGFGEKSLSEVKELIEGYGLSLKK